MDHEGEPTNAWSKWRSASKLGMSEKHKMCEVFVLTNTLEHTQLYHSQFSQTIWEQCRAEKERGYCASDKTQMRTNGRTSGRHSRELKTGGTGKAVGCEACGSACPESKCNTRETLTRKVTRRRKNPANPKLGAEMDKSDPSRMVRQGKCMMKMKLKDKVSNTQFVFMQVGVSSMTCKSFEDRRQEKQLSKL